jgi:DNA-binding beta-propeller fold protein YncE
MTHRSATLLLGVFATAMLLTPRPAPAQAAAYHVSKRQVIGGVGGWDYLTIDSVGRRLMVTRTNRVSAIDLASGAVVAEMPGLNRGHGVAFDYARGHGFASSGEDSAVVEFDRATLKEIGRTTAAVDADAILFDRVSDRVFTFNGDAGTASVIDPTGPRRVASIDLGGKPEFAVTDERGTIYVNIADKAQVAAIDVRSLKVTRRWSIAPCEDPSGLAIDRAHDRLFSVCGNRRMAVSDAARGRVVAMLPIGAGVDAAGFDPATSTVFASNGEGTLTVIHEDTPDRYRVTQTLATMAGARTMTIDPLTHRIYTVGASYGPVPAAITKENPRRRAPMVPNSATVVVVER